MKKSSDSARDEEDLQRGAQRLRALLRLSPEEFESWANETLDMSRMKTKLRRR